MNTFIQPSTEGEAAAGLPDAPRARAKAATRARILAAARSALEAHGYEGTNLRDVARDARVAVGTVLLHFADKKDLLHAAFHDALDDTARRAVRAARGEATLAAQLHAVAGTFFAHYEARPALARALLRESLFADAPWAARFAAQVGSLSEELARFVDEAKARGELRASAEGPVVVAAFFSFYYFALLAWLQGGHPDPRRLLGALVAQHLAPLGPAAPASPRSARRTR